MINLSTNNERLTTLKVVFAPWYTQENPYQTQLTEKLMSLGVTIESTNCSNASLLFTIKQKKANILHIHWLDHFFLSRVNFIQACLKLILFAIQLVVLRLTNVKIIWTVHNLKNHKNQHLILDKLGSILVSRIAHGLIVHSESAKHEVVKTFYLNKDKEHKIFVIPHGNYIDIYENNISQVDAKKQLDISHSSLVLLFFGLIHPYKGVLKLIEAFKQLNYDDICLLIAGKPCNEFVADQLIKQAKDNKNIKFIPGFVAKEQVQLYMNACDIVALPYREFLTSGALILAMSFGKACIAPDKGYIGEVLNDHGGFLYDPDEEEGLLKALNSVVNQRSVLSNMGNYNYKLAEQWSWDYVAKLTLNVYENFLNY